MAGTHFPGHGADRSLDADAVEMILADEIDRLHPGDRLPGERDLVTRFAVPRAMIRRALDRLAARFLIRRVPGVGSFVADRVDLLVSNREAASLHAAAAAAGHTARTRLVSSAEAPLPERAARMLGVEPGRETLSLVRVGTLDEVPATFAREWLVPTRTRDLDAALGVFESVYESLRAFGFYPQRGRTTATVEDLPSEVRAECGHRNPALAWRMITANVDATTGQPLTVSDTWLRMNLIRLVFGFSSD